MITESTLLYVDKKESSFKKLRANMVFQEGDVVIELENAEELPEPDYTTIDLNDRHVYHAVGRYINHSCDPSASVNAERKTIVATRQINPGDEITFNYLISERRIVAPFDCRCGSEKCVGRIEK